ncbi:inosine-uridine preferring nucleoside hydrolase-domain-containing protein [Xylaria sp. CBS 124048]|nr:inosine-uridine preferring nucleoside hydrolase-domain-containing protein [Xylaria sp. CBS 124048]
MNNEQFRRLIAANATRSPAANSDGASSTRQGREGAALGSRQKSSIPMTPRSVSGIHKSDFARQLAERNQTGNTPKFRSFAPKGSKLAEGYIDRTKARQSEEDDERAVRLKALEEALKNEEIDQQTFENLRGQITGGDLSSTHLVKGLDKKLLERVRRGENVYDDSKTQDGDQEIPEDIDEELDRLQKEEVDALVKDKATKKGQLSTAPIASSKKRTRDQILAEMKAAREAAKAKEEPILGTKFKRIGARGPQTRIERDNKGREVMITVDEDGNEKRKVRRIQSAGDKPSQKANDLMMPDPKAKPLGMEVPDIYKAKAEQSDEDDVNIFDEVDDDYDPLAGLSEGEEEEEEEEGENEKDDTADAQAKIASADKKTKDAVEPVSQTQSRNYFKDAKTGLVSSEILKAPAMSDPAIQAAFKKAASLHAITNRSEEDDVEAREKAERRRRMLQNDDRDAEDMDLGFGTSRFEDDADLDEQRVKLSEWGRDGEDDNSKRGASSKRKRGPKKRKGDANSAADVLHEMERQRAANLDVFAILLGAYHPGIKLLGISTVHGNASVRKTTNNALSVLAAIGKEDTLKVHVGASRPLTRDPFHAVTIHGESGLDGTDLLPPPALSALSTVPAVDAIASALRACQPNTAWVVATGGLTNIAELFAAHPDLRSHIAGLSIMGGSIGDNFTPAPLGRVDNVERIGNYTQWAEFNVLIDPEAGAALLEDPILAPKTTLIPLDLTHLVLATKEAHNVEVNAKTTLRQMLVELLMFFAGTYRDVFGLIDGPPLHDPLAVAAILTGTIHEIPLYDFDPSNPQAAAASERFEVRVVTEGTFDEAMKKGAQTGRTLARLLPPGEKGVRIPRGVDVKMFWDVIEQCCKRADDVNARRA